MQLPQSKGLIAFLWAIGFSMGIVFFFMISKYYAPIEPTRDVYLNVVNKSRILSQMRIHLLHAVEMEKSAVMALTDKESRDFADQSLAASAAVDKDLKSLLPLIDTTSLQDEKKLAAEFSTCWTEFRKLDQIILELAVQNTNLKAAALSREKGAGALQQFAKNLELIAQPQSETTHGNRLTEPSLHAMAAGLHILNLQNSHIAETDSGKMDQIETAMKAEEKEAAKALDELSLLTAASKSQAAVERAKKTFDEFMAVTGQVINLSRQNSNIKSLELSLGKKRLIAAQCEEILAAFQETVQNRPFKASK
jgi:hypothetical protein